MPLLCGLTGNIIDIPCHNSSEFVSEYNCPNLVAYVFLLLLPFGHGVFADPRQAVVLPVVSKYYTYLLTYYDCRYVTFVGSV